MEKEIPFYNTGNEPFVAGTGPLQLPYKRLYKIRGAAILYCRRGKGLVTIDLKTYTVTENTVVIFLPNSIVNITKVSPDFLLSYFICSTDMFWETIFRLDTEFLHFLKTNPYYTFPIGFTNSIEGLLEASAVVYADRENRFRYPIAKNLLHNFLLDTCDKIYRRFPRKEIESSSRRIELFRKFIDLVHQHCTQQREVNFYADALCISTKYLTDICRFITGGSAKKIIDDLTILEIKLLLQSTNLLMQEIADRLNFPDQSYLGRFFKRHEGISPIEYRNQFL